MTPRKAIVRRQTKETKITVRVNLDGRGQAVVDTGIGFFDHMLELVARHAVIDLELRCRGDLEVDGHHTVEDCGLALGEAVAGALGDKRGIRRYGSGFAPPAKADVYVPMDECLARCVIDLGGRPYFVWRGLDHLGYKIVAHERRQDMACQFRFGLAREFFQAFATSARCNLHLELLYGQEPHHIVEALFKAFARSLEAACRLDPRIRGKVPSTKGTL